MLEEKVIELSKVKVILLILGAISFVLLGAWILTLDVQAIESQRRFNNPTLVYGMGVASIVFFGLCGLLGARKLFDKSPGVVINAEGILDNSSGISAEIIPWAQVTGVGEYKVKNQKFISIHIQNPEEYANIGSAFKKMASKANLKMCGTPINISTNTLKISYDELLEIINEYYNISRKGA